MSAQKVATFKDRFAELFAESEKTIVDLAKDLHVSYQTISAWKTGFRSPKEPTVIAIADHFNVSVEWLMGFDVPKESTRHDKMFVPDSKLFSKIMKYISPSDYVIVVQAFERTYERMKQLGVDIDD